MSRNPFRNDRDDSIPLATRINRPDLFWGVFLGGLAFLVAAWIFAVYRAPPDKNAIPRGSGVKARQVDPLSPTKLKSRTRALVLKELGDIHTVEFDKEEFEHNDEGMLVTGQVQAYYQSGAQRFERFWAKYKRNDDGALVEFGFY